jgi:hypothetical protein
MLRRIAALCICGANFRFARTFLGVPDLKFNGKRGGFTRRIQAIPSAIPDKQDRSEREKAARLGRADLSEKNSPGSSPGG